MSGTVVLSFDCELGWGRIEDGGWRHLEAEGLYERTLPVLSRVIETLESRAIPSTWAFVGSLFEVPDPAALDHLPAAYRAETERFIHEAQPSTRSLDSLLPAFRRLGPMLDLGSHSSTHVRARTPGSDTRTMAADFELSLRQLERSFDRPVTSVIFPRDELDALDEVGALGSFSVRVPGGHYGTPSMSGLDRARLVASRALGPVPPAVDSVLNSGNPAQTGSLYFNWAIGSGVVRRIRRLLHGRAVDAVLRDAALTGAPYHLWVHPFNLAESDRLAADFLGFVDRLAALRDASKLTVEHMAGHHARTLPSR